MGRSSVVKLSENDDSVQSYTHVSSQKQPEEDRDNLQVTVDTIRKSVPPECFEISTLKSTCYLAFDLCAIAALYYAEPHFETYAGWAGLVTWYCLMGMFGATLFAVGHDCCHGAFSQHAWVNDLCGHITHSPILISFWPLQKSHRGHHNFTNHLTKDFGHHWMQEEELNSYSSVAKNLVKLPIVLFVEFVAFYQLLGLHDGSHYWPLSKLFVNGRERIQCAVSTVACLACIVVAFSVLDYDISKWLKFYFVPVLFTSYWIMMITYLEHHEPDTEVYTDGSWTFLRGQLQTVDRRFGFGLDWILHHLTDGHLAHHLFRRIPHYNLPKATEAIRAHLDERRPGSYKLISSYDFAIQIVR